MRAPLAASGLALAVAGSLLVATPAVAAPFVDGGISAGGTTWRVEGLGAGQQPEIKEAQRPGWEGNSFTFDQGVRPVSLAADSTGPTDVDLAECAADGDLSPAADSTGDQIASCELSPLETGDGTLEAALEWRFFDDGATVRARMSVTNATGDTVSGATIGFRDNYYQDTDTRLGASTTAGHPAAEDDAVVDGDLLWITYAALDATSIEAPVILTAAGTADSTVTPQMASSAGDGGDLQITLYALPDIEPGDTVEVVHFYVWQFFEFDEVNPVDAADARANLEPAALFVPSALAAVETAWDARGRFDTLSDRDAAGIAEPSAVLNWNAVDEPSDPAEPELADTGVENAWPLTALAAILVLCGAGIIALRRRAA
ncbi:MAG: LPXTG cell wall anchor domain-containing protein [Microcella sp.]|uniref:LPXTG cell wall anchor domain-containing protein n=1 Tax=Microcella sp. TaxID=1913979 RepID=UPI00331497AF